MSFLGIRDNNSILSIDLNQDEDEIIIERDSPGYSSFQCLSDIGKSITFKLPLLHSSARACRVYDVTFERWDRWFGPGTVHCVNFEINGIFLLPQQRIRNPPDFDRLPTNSLWSMDTVEFIVCLV